MQRRNLILIAVAGIVAVVVGLTTASIFGLDISFLSGFIGGGNTNGIYPP